MHFKIRTIGDPLLFADNEIPSELIKFHIPGSQITSASGAFGKCLLQSIDTGSFSWLYCVFEINRDVLFQLSIFTTDVICKIALQETIEHKVQSIKDVCLKEGEFTIIKSPSFIDTFNLKKPGTYSFIDIFYPTEYMLLALKRYPSLHEFEKKLRCPHAILSHEKGLPLGAVSTDLLYKILHAPFSLTIKQFHIDIIKEILYEMFKQATTTVQTNLKFSAQKIEAIRAAKEFIDASIPNHFSISKIARRIGVNERILKVGFRELYGMGLYTYLQSQILMIAKKQLEETNKAVKEIAFDVGYQKANNFSAAFKKKFGKSPVEWRKQFGQK
jgi:AraC-like DNA-binding protein